MVEIFKEYSDYVMFFSVLLAMMSLVFCWKFDKAMKCFAVYLIMGGCVEYLALEMSERVGNNLFLLHIYTILEFIVLSAFFKVVFDQLGSKFSMLKITIVVVLLCILNSIFIQPLEGFNSYASTLVGLVLIVYSAYTFYLLLDKDGVKFRNIKWLVAGILIYQMTSFIILASANLLSDITPGSDVILWMVRAIVILFTKIIFGFVLFKEILKPKYILRFDI
ncbi:MAG: hypothetical protein ACI86M_000901 [Saprospiraceae bacterium]|jgi:hypothetical protein